jgi:hypothetical protein
VTDFYEHLAGSFARVASFATVGAVLGTVAAAVHKDYAQPTKASYGEWAAYSGALAGIFSLTFELARSI